MKNPDWTIPAAPESLDDIEQARTFNAAGRSHTFVKTSAGKVYRLLPRRPIDLSESWESNETLRRAVCRLTGKSMSDLKSAITKRRNQEAVRHKKLQTDRLRSLAKSQGYRLVKVKTP